MKIFFSFYFVLGCVFCSRSATFRVRLFARVVYTLRLRSVLIMHTQLIAPRDEVCVAAQRNREGVGLFCMQRRGSARRGEKEQEGGPSNGEYI